MSKPINYRGYQIYEADDLGPLIIMQDDTSCVNSPASVEAAKQWIDRQHVADSERTPETWVFVDADGHRHENFTSEEAALRYAKQHGLYVREMLALTRDGRAAKQEKPDAA
jgi:hypothetical protein